VRGSSSCRLALELAAACVAEEAEPHVHSGSPKEWLDRLEREHDNLRAALDRLEVNATTVPCIQARAGRARARLDGVPANLLALTKLNAL